MLGLPLIKNVQFTISLGGEDTSTQRYFTLFLGNVTFYPETFILNSTILTVQGSNLKEIKKKTGGGGGFFLLIPEQQKFKELVHKIFRIN